MTLIGRQPKNSKKWIRLIRYLLVLSGVLWIAVIAISLTWNISQAEQNVMNYALLVARTAFEKDVLYRAWSSQHGGVYVPITADTQPNPYLKDTPNQNIQGQDGKSYTLINPAYMTRQVFALQTNFTDVIGHITSKKPIRPENKADEWEVQALVLFERGAKEFSSIELINGKRYFRYMQPLVVEESCMRCHSQQGYQVGQIRGGISESVPVARLESNQAENISILWFGHIAIGLAGFLGMGLAIRMMRDSVEGQEKAEEQLIFMGYHDALTGLYNRAHFEEMIQSRSWGDGPVSILAADIDNLKITNDTFGHAAGDDLIRKTAEILKRSLRSVDEVARTGGDEFMAVIPGMDKEMAEQVMERIRHHIDLANADEGLHGLSVSVGIASSLPARPIQEILHLADEAMYAEKQAKKRRQPG